MFYRLPLYAGMLGAGALLIATLFFLGPALATQQAKRPLLAVIENSFGSMPACTLRLCCALFLVLWISGLVAVPGVWWLSYILRRKVSSAESGMVIGGLLIFLFITGLQSLRTSAKLAVFTNKLGIAILVAAMLRVRQGWPTTKGVQVYSEGPAVSDLWHGLSLLAFDVAPLALLAASLGHRIQGQKQVAKTALMGIALPVFGTLLFVGIINVSTLHSPFYTPSLNPNVAMALWGKAAASALPGRMMVTAITMFGAVRFGARSLEESVSFGGIGSRVRLVLLACLIVGITWSSLHQDNPRLSMAFEISARCLAVAGAVLTADLVTGRLRLEPARRIDWIGVVALLAGLATPLYVPLLSVGATSAFDPWWHPWLLPSFGVAFLVSLVSGTVRKMFRSKAL